MKALTICQPYAELIARGDKRVENRTWETKYRGTILIHAGKSQDYMTLDYGVPLAEMTFGAFIATADLIDCLWIDDIGAGEHDAKYPWGRTHDHTEGDWCWILDNVQRLPKPVPWRGALSLWEAPYDEVRARSLQGGEKQ